MSSKFYIITFVFHSWTHDTFWTATLNPNRKISQFFQLYVILLFCFVVVHTIFSALCFMFQSNIRLQEGRLFCYVFAGILDNIMHLTLPFIWYSTAYFIAVTFWMINDVSYNHSTAAELCLLGGLHYNSALHNPSPRCISKVRPKRGWALCAAAASD